MRTRSGWLWILSLIIFVLAAAWLAWGPPSHVAPGREPLLRHVSTAWSPRSNTVVGIRAVIRLGLPWPVSARDLRSALRVSDGDAYRVSPSSDNHWQIAPPPQGWPAGRPLTLAVGLRALYPGRAVVPVSQDVLHVDRDRHLVVNLSYQTMQVYQGTTLLRTMPVSTGLPPDYTTPDGTFWIFRRVRWDRMRGGTPGTPTYYDVPHVPFSQYIYGGVAIHGAYWNQHFGVPRSHGCIQLATRAGNPRGAAQVEDAGWLWRFTHIGDPVTVVGTTPSRRTREVRNPSPNARHSL